MLALLFFEGGLAVSAIPSFIDGTDTFARYHKRALGAIVRASYSSGRLPSDGELRTAMRDPRTQRSIDDLFALDDAIQYSEIAGIISYEWDENGPYLNFYQSKTLNQQFAEDIRASSDPLELISRNERFYKDVTEMPTDFFALCIKRKDVTALTDCFMFQSDASAFIDIPLMYYEQMCAIEGRVLGEFHLHQADMPRGSDLQSDWYIVARPKPYRLYRTAEGKSYVVR